MFHLISGGIKAGIRQPYLALRRRRKRVVRPLFLDYAVTWRCNARCIMCDTWKTKGTEDQELTPKDWDAILTRDADFLRAMKKIGLTGGEPFLRSDLVELLEVLHRRLPWVRISLVSNGLMPERTLKALERIKEFCPELVFSVSLDGLGEVHDQVRGIPGAFDKALATLKGALALGFTVTSGMTLSQVNFDQIGPVSSLLSEMGVDFSCNLQERGQNFHNQDKADELQPQQEAQIARDLEAFGHHYYMDQVRGYLMGLPRTLPCYSGYTSYFLHPNGDLAYCNLIGEPLGNLAKQPFLEIADSAKAWEMREQLKDCTCLSQCEVKNSAAVAPWHVLKWLAKNPRKLGFLSHYARKSGILPH
ncbi:MAG: radical SAM protein [Desulfarculaceae bacterium]|jgi:MoaA/NifB/PqqE/SkfB family radical SAM enzyme